MIDVKATLSESEERMEMAAMFLEDQLAKVRAGRANVAILDGIRVNSYGSMVPLNLYKSVYLMEFHFILFYFILLYTTYFILR